jgi:hypothetical protein
MIGPVNREQALAVDQVHHNVNHANFW